MDIYREGDIIMCKVLSIEQTHVIVSPLEADIQGLEAMLSIPEISKTRIKSIRKEISINAVEPMVIVSLDASNGYMDVSKKRVSEEDAQKCKDRYRKIKGVQLLVSSLSLSTKQSKEHVQEALGIDYNTLDTLASFYDTMHDLEIINNQIINNALKEYIQKKFVVPAVPITLYFSLIPVECDDIYTIKDILSTIIHTYPETTIRLVNSPTYSICIDAVNEKEAKNLMHGYLKEHGQKLREKGIDLIVKV